MAQASANQADKSLFGDPDCVRCMRKKLRATGVVVFFKTGHDWHLGNFEGDKPSAAAQTDFECMLRFGVPQSLEPFEGGIVIPDDQTLSGTLGKAASLLEGCCVIAAPVHRGHSVGVRLAWRDQTDPFTAQELDIIHCEGLCPTGCG